MGVSLSKGGNVSLSKEVPGLEAVFVGLGWDAKATSTGHEFDLDAVAFLLKSTNKVRFEKDFVYYNNLTGDNGNIKHQGDHLTGGSQGDDEQILIQLNSISSDVIKIIIAVNIHQAVQRRQNFGQVSNAFIRIVNAKDSKEIARYDLSEYSANSTTMIFAEIYRKDGEWKMRAIGQDFSGGLKSLAESFGVNIFS